MFGRKRSGVGSFFLESGVHNTSERWQSEKYILRISKKQDLAPVNGRCAAERWWASRARRQSAELRSRHSNL